MDFTIGADADAWRRLAATLARDLHPASPPVDVVHAAGQSGLFRQPPNTLGMVLAVTEVASASAPAAMALAFHMSALDALANDPTASALTAGDLVGGVALSSDGGADLTDGSIDGRATWVAPVTRGGVVLVGARASRESLAGGHQSGASGALQAAVIALDASGVSIEPIVTAALQGLPCAHLSFSHTPCRTAGSTRPIMSRVRLLVSGAALGMGRRALAEALAAARLSRTAGVGEQTVQGLLADAATDLEAASLLVWRAATSRDLTLGAASIAKLSAVAAVQRAVERATQVIGAASFERGHIVERLAQDVRALELFAGRTEALREAAAAELLPCR